MQDIIESILFASGSPVSIDLLALVLETDKITVSAVMSQMLERYNEGEGGIALLKLGDCYQLASRREYCDYVKKALDNRREAFLSAAALEVLAIIAYNQPITRGYVSQVRGVDCSEIIDKLEEKELVEECGKLDAPGRPRLFRTTPEFLRIFGLSALTDLPDLDEIDLDGGQIKMEEVMA